MTPVEAETEPWTYGWYIDSYRRSGSAALPGPAGPVTIGSAGLGSYEECVRQLAREPAIRERWDLDELWGLVANLVVATAGASDPQAFVSENLHRLRTAEPSLVVVPVANVTWASPPMEVAGGVFGSLDDNLRRAVASAASGRRDLSGDDASNWVHFQTGVQGGAEASRLRLAMGW